MIQPSDLPPHPAMLSLRDHLTRATAILSAPGGESPPAPADRQVDVGCDPRLEAELLLAHCLGRSRTYLYAHSEAHVDAAIATRYRALVTRRAAGIPVAYLTGEREFWSMALEVSPDTLIPRPETETLVDVALEVLATTPHPHIVDLGTGSGAVALALGTELPRARVIATDLSRPALALAAANRERHQRANVSVVRAAWLQPFAAETFDLIVSNPPYVAQADPHLTQGDVLHEPRRALVAGPDGLSALRAIATQAPARLRPGGWLALEHGHTQGPAVRELLHRAGLGEVSTLPDLAGRERVTRARKP